MGCRKGEKIMKIPAEFEDIFRGVELTEREALFLSWITSWDDYTIQNMRTVLEKVRSTLSTLQAENEKLLAELDDLRIQWDMYGGDVGITAVYEELEQVKQERDAAVGDMEALMWYSGEGCQICANAVEVHKRPYVRLDCKLGSGIDCKPKWRGQKEG